MPISHDAEISRLMTDYRHGNKAVDTIEAAFVAIEEAEDPGIFISLVDREDALSAARELGGRIDPTKPLYGVPFAVKDNIDVAGMPTTAACPDYAYTPTASAPVVDRLIEAGAILIGKTNLDQFATGLVGTRDGVVHEIHAGQTVWCPADEDHWHGAGDTGSPMSHITVQQAGSQTTVLDD